MTALERMLIQAVRQATTTAIDNCSMESAVQRELSRGLFHEAGCLGELLSEVPRVSTATFQRNWMVIVKGIYISGGGSGSGSTYRLQVSVIIFWSDYSASSPAQLLSPSPEPEP